MPSGYDYYALMPLWIGNVLAFSPGQLVPDTTVTSQSWTVGVEVQTVGMQPPPPPGHYEVRPDTDGIPYILAVP